MPKTTVEKGKRYSLPKETLLPAVLEEVEEQVINYTIKKGPNAGQKDSFTKWRWKFTITEGEYAGVAISGDTDGKATNLPGDKPREWYEALAQVAVDLGDGFDTDNVIGLPCKIEVEHEEPRETSRGNKFYPNPVVRVYPEGTTQGEVYPNGSDPGEGFEPATDPAPY
jgi:hypothetical protein